jgi:hypothetical protein
LNWLLTVRKEFYVSAHRNLNRSESPSTFVLDGQGIIRFAKISHSHGDRTKAADIVEELKRFRQ